ncbi:MAG TPA: L,D-transpeptidase [Solirubrobacteraceae bacterium]|nr:L,D-transpeptidase [Solirubrobacteraceae bacterium]
MPETPNRSLCRLRASLRRIRRGALPVGCLAALTAAGLADGRVIAPHPTAANSREARAGGRTASARRPASGIAASQPVALLYTAHRALAAPRADARTVGEIAMHRPITGERTVLPVLARATDADGVGWLKVRLPGRPNGHTGWIRRRGTRASVVFWHLLIDLRARRVTAYLDGQPQRSFRAVVGKPSTPTPTGQFFVEETVRMTPGDPGGPYALALSARSTAFRRFDGGPGQVAVHGRDGLGGTLGKAQSHGCVRLARGAIAWLVGRFGPGTPVTIRAR